MTELTPAYGRDYKSAKAVVADWNAGKDFVFATTGQYTSKADWAGKTVLLRYAKLTKVAVVKG